MNCQNRDDLEFIIWRQVQEIERLKGENAWMRKNVAVVIEKDNELVSENRILKEKIETFEKAKNANVPLANHADVFTKSSLWHQEQTENNCLLDVIFKRNPDKTVRVPITEAAIYVAKELS